MAYVSRRHNTCCPVYLHRASPATAVDWGVECFVLSHRHSTVVGILAGFVILAVILVALLAALVRRRRWAWLVLLLLFGVSLALDLVNFNNPVRFSLDVIVFTLLISPLMRRYVNQANARDRRPGLGGSPHAE